MAQTVKDYYTFSRRERQGVIVLLTLIICSTFIDEVYEKHFKEYQTVVIPPLDTVQAEEDSIAPLQKKLEPKDLNQADAESLAELRGIGKVLSARIVKYRNSIGGFEKVEDLKTVYGITDELYEDISDKLYVSPIIKEKRNVETAQFTKRPQAPKIKIDLNSADSATFTLLKGIGPVLASRTVKYRYYQGGFDSIAQIKQVYGIEDELYERIKDQLFLSQYSKKSPTKYRDTSSYKNHFVKENRKKEVITYNFDINTVSAEELEQISGIGPFFSSQVVKQRQILGGFAEMEQLLEIFKMNEETYNLLIKNSSIQSPHQKFLLDTVSFNSLLKMNILKFEEVKYVFLLKKSKGKITSMDEINTLQGISDKKKALLAQYLMF